MLLLLFFLTEMASSLLISPHNLLCSATFNRKRALLGHRGDTVGLMSPRCTRSLVLSPGGTTLTETAKGRERMVPCKGDGVVPPGIGIVRFLSGKNLFVTGATGFLAKVLIEKILRTVPEVGKVFLLIKAKNTEAATERLKHQIVDADLFKCLRKIHGRGYESFMQSKLIPVAGNVCEAGLGMDGEIANIVAGAVDIVVNSAATTTFDERYDVSVEINTKGPCRLMKFAKRCDNLQLFLQVSTAYVNGQRQGTIFERPFGKRGGGAREGFVSETPYSLSKLHLEAEIESAVSSGKAINGDFQSQKMKELGLERARKYGWQDTYVFTKAMGEMMIDNMRGDIPVVIIRPSVIESTYKDPFPGWIEGNRFDSSNTESLMEMMSNEERTEFGFDVRSIDWRDYISNVHIPGLRKHVMKGRGVCNIA